MKATALAAALFLLSASSTLCKADSRPWCAADIAILNFKNYEGQDLARIELRSLKAVCDRPPDKKVVGVVSERSMRIEHNGQWIDVPKECLSGVAFGTDGLALSGSEAGLGIVVIGKQADGDERVETMIFKLRDDILCSRVERCPNADDPPGFIRECSRHLR